METRRRGVEETGPKRKGTRRRKRRKNPPKVQRVVSDEMVAAVQKAFFDWLWAAFAERDLPVEDVAEEIGLKRQGLAKVLRRKSKAVRFATMVRTIFVHPEKRMRIAIAVEGWKIEICGTIEQSNDRYVSGDGTPP